MGVNLENMFSSYIEGVTQPLTKELLIDFMIIRVFLPEYGLVIQTFLLIFP